jgi:hypothetical protein
LDARIDFGSGMAASWSYLENSELDCVDNASEISASMFLDWPLWHEPGTNFFVTRR